MSNCKEKILKIIEEKPKHFSKIIKKNIELSNWVKNNKLINSNNYAECIRSALFNESNICEIGNIKKFSSINVGFIGCGPSNLCDCTRKKTSNSVKKSKSLTTKEEQENINFKREQTVLKKYGVKCVAQTPENIKKFKEWYANPENVKTNLEKIRSTNLEKYGVENCKSLPEVEEKIIATCLARYGVKNVSQIPSTKAKLKARTAEYKLTGHLIKKGFFKFKNYIESNFEVNLKTTIDDYKGVELLDKILIECKICKEKEYKNFYYNKNINCEKCFPRIPNFTSKEEQEVFDFITNDLKIQYGIQGDKKLINPYELDMIFHNEKIAIEYCGLYWHSEHSAGKNKSYHFNKLKMVNSIGYRLITIFSDEWNQKKDIVKSKLRNIFKKTNIKYYARKLKVKEVSAVDSNDFLNKHHLQGSSSAKINLGLYSDDNLVALMTFSNGRAALNNKVVINEYELVRFVTNGTSVVGGASKLLKYFIKNYNPKKIISYSDNRWSDGSLYKTLGFNKVSSPTIGYWYVDNYTDRLHRFNFTKKELVKAGNDSLLTEWEILQKLGYDRIWDCGHQKFVLNIEK